MTQLRRQQFQTNIKNGEVVDSQNRRIGLYYLTQRYTIHDGNVPIAETDSSGDVTRWFVRGVGIAEGTGDVLAEIDSSDNAHYYLPNHRGDTLVVLDENGSIEKQIRYDAFGNIKEQTGTFTPKYTFSTKEYLSDAELYLYAYRVYDPIAGRWTQRDPIDYQDSVNLYQFCGNNPVNAWDADGRSVTLIVIGVLFAIGFCIAAKAKLDADEQSTKEFINKANNKNTSAMDMSKAKDTYIDNIKKSNNIFSKMHDLLSTFLGTATSPAGGGPDYKNFAEEEANWGNEIVDKINSDDSKENKDEKK